MSELGIIIHAHEFENKRRHQNRKNHIEEKGKEIPEKYEGDIKLFLNYCDITKQEINPESMLDYLYISLMEERVKKNTWERRLASIKKYLSVIYEIDFNAEPIVASEISVIRKLYKEEQNSKLIQVKGKSAVDKDDLVKMIHKLPTREKAICLVNLITANRPNEMVRLKIDDFDLDGSFVSVYLRKQDKWHNKRLTPEVIRAVHLYISEYKLKTDDYFIGRVYKGGRYESREISVNAYQQSLKKWTGFTAYNLRKTQVTSMHEAGADLSTIAKQTGHTSLETLDKHYLNVTDSTVDKYL